MRRKPQPCSANPCAPYWLIPTPCPQPRPSITNVRAAAAGAAANTLRTASATTRRRIVRPSSSADADAGESRYGIGCRTTVHGVAAEAAASAACARSLCRGAGLERGALELEQRDLAVEAAAISHELPARADDPVTWKHDRDRIPVHHRSDGTGRPRSPGTRSERSVRRHLTVRDLGEPLEDGAVEVGHRPQVELEVEVAPPPLEVLVQLAPRAVDRTRGTEHARAERSREHLLVAFRVRVELDPADPGVACRHEQRPDRRVDDVVRDVEQLRRHCGRPKALVELGGDRHGSSFLRSRRTPEDVAWRAASGLDPRAAAISSYAKS